MMYKFIENEIDTIIHNLQLNITKTDINTIYSLLTKNFKLNTTGIYKEIWLQLIVNHTPNFYIQNENGWKISVQKIDTYPCFLLIDNSTDKVAYQINSAEDLLKLLEETTGFTYYICNKYANSILFFNSYDTLALFTVSVCEQAS